MLEFQTASSDAILLYLQGSVYADFLALQLRGGILVFSYNLGSGRVDIESEGTYDDGEIHTVRYDSSFLSQLLLCMTNVITPAHAG